MNKKIKELYPQLKKVSPKKYQSGDKTIVVMPSHQVKRDLSDYAYGKDIDEKIINMATQLAEKMATSMIRELAGLNVTSMVDKVIEGVVAKIEAKLPEQQTIIREVVREGADEIRQKAQSDFTFDGPDIAVDRSKGLNLKGDIGKTTKKKGSLDEQLDALDDLLQS